MRSPKGLWMWWQRIMRPHLKHEKEQAYPKSPSGMPGVQTFVPIMLDHINAGRLSLERFVDLACHGPQRVFGVAGKGRLAVGYDADLHRGRYEKENRHPE